MILLEIYYNVLLMKKSFLLFGFLLLYITFIHSQDYQILNYDDNNGLQSNLTKAIAQDSFGFIWIATDNGLARFDGINFKAFQKGLPSNYVKGLTVLKSKQLIALTDMGVVEIISKIDTAYFVPFISGSEKSTDSTLEYYTRNLYEAFDSSLWFSGHESVYHYKNKKLKTYAFDKKNTTSSYYLAFSFLEDSLGNLFAFSQQGYIHQYDSKLDKFVEIKNVEKLPLVNGVFSSKFGDILVATENGIRMIQYDKSLKFSVKNFMHGINFSCIGMSRNHTIFAGSRLNGFFNLYKHKENYQFENIPNLPAKAINSIFFDKDDNVWLSTDAGIIFMYPTFFTSNVKGLKQIYISDIKKDLENTIYVCNGISAYSLYNENNRLKAKLLLNKENGDIIQFLPVGKKILYSTSFGELGWLDRDKIIKSQISKVNKALFIMQKDKFDNIWLCTSEIEGIQKLLPDNRLIGYNSKYGNLTNKILSLAQDSEGTLYCGASTDTAYLYRYDRNADSFKNISIPIQFEHSKNIIINDIAISGKSIYLATSDGLLMLENNTISHVSLKEFENQNALSVEVDRNKNLWIGFDNGVIKYSKNHVVLFNKEDGLPANSAAYRNILVDDKNNVFVGTTSGLAYSFKNNQSESKTPKPIINSILFNGIESSKIATILEGSYVTFRFLSLSYPGKDVQYQTWIVGINNNWSIETYSNELFIPKLKNGKYTLYVRALKHGNYLWSEPAIYNFNVESNWYNNWWAYSFYFILTGLLIFGIVKLNIRRLEREKEHLEGIVIQRTAEVMHQNDEMILHKNEIESQAVKLQIQNNKLQELNATKDKLFSIIAHDLRNPFSSILGFSELLVNNIDSYPKEKIQKFAQTINESSNQTYKLLENLLEWSKIQRGTLVPDIQAYHLKEIVESIFMLCNEMAKIKNIALNNTISNEILINCDIEMTKTVLRNLIINAIKFTNSGGIVSILSRENKLQIEIEVRDTGVGIPAEKIPRLFNIEKNISTQGTEKEMGTGLGLLLCRELVEKQNGKIWVESKEGKGASFYFTMPVIFENKIR